MDQKVILLNKNPAISRLITLSMQKMRADFEEVDALENAKLCEVLIVDNALGLDARQAKSLCKSLILLVSKSDTPLHAQDIYMLKKPFLPTDFLGMMKDLLEPSPAGLASSVNIFDEDDEDDFDIDLGFDSDFDDGLGDFSQKNLAQKKAKLDFAAFDEELEEVDTSALMDKGKKQGRVRQSEAYEHVQEQDLGQDLAQDQALAQEHTEQAQVREEALSALGSDFEDLLREDEASGLDDLGLETEAEIEAEIEASGLDDLGLETEAEIETSGLDDLGLDFGATELDESELGESELDKDLEQDLEGEFDESDELDEFDELEQSEPILSEEEEFKAETQELLSIIDEGLSLDEKGLHDMSLAKSLDEDLASDESDESDEEVAKIPETLEAPEVAEMEAEAPEMEIEAPEMEAEAPEMEIEAPEMEAEIAEALETEMEAEAPEMETEMEAEALEIEADTEIEISEADTETITEPKEDLGMHFEELSADYDELDEEIAQEKAEKEAKHELCDNVAECLIEHLAADLPSLDELDIKDALGEELSEEQHEKLAQRAKDRALAQEKLAQEAAGEVFELEESLNEEASEASEEASEASEEASEASEEASEASEEASEAIAQTSEKSSKTSDEQKAQKLANISKMIKENIEQGLQDDSIKDIDIQIKISFKD